MWLFCYYSVWYTKSRVFAFLCLAPREIVNGEEVRKLCLYIWYICEWSRVVWSCFVSHKLSPLCNSHIWQHKHSNTRCGRTGWWDAAAVLLFLKFYFSSVIITPKHTQHIKCFPVTWNGTGRIHGVIFDFPWSLSGITSAGSSIDYVMCWSRVVGLLSFVCILVFRALNSCINVCN